MSGAKHTPGPWVTGLSNHGSRKTAVWTAKGDIQVAKCVSEVLSLEGNRVNARLIAAAPEMLDELRRAETNLRNLPAYVGQADAIARLIAKATGAQA